MTKLYPNADLPACGLDRIHNAETKNSGRRIEWINHVTWKKMKAGIASRFVIVVFGIDISVSVAIRKLVH